MQDVRKISTADLTKMSMCVALCCVTAYISFPLPFTPGMVTALTIALSLAAYILNPRQTFIVILVYILLGAAGLPVFAAGSSGLSRLIGPTGGFYFAWLIAYPLLSFFRGARINFKRYVVTNILIAMPITYLGGIISIMIFMQVDLWQALAMAVLPYIPGDVMKAAAAAFLGVRLNSALC